VRYIAMKHKIRVKLASLSRYSVTVRNLPGLLIAVCLPHLEHDLLESRYSVLLTVPRAMLAYGRNAVLRNVWRLQCMLSARALSSIAAAPGTWRVCCEMFCRGKIHTGFQQLVGKRTVKYPSNFSWWHVEMIIF